MLDKQFQVLSVDTNDFFTNNEMRLYRKLHKLRREKRELKEADRTDWYKEKTTLEYKCKENLLRLLENKFDQNLLTNGKFYPTTLRSDSIYDEDGNIKVERVVNIFDSNLARCFEFTEDRINIEYIIVQIYYFSTFKNMIYYGFEFNNEKYIYYSSSAGQIRLKKGVFVKEKLYLKNIDNIMCGLSIQKINAKGGINPNKLLSYLALSSSATDVWNEFDIDKVIVIDDFETMVEGDFDFIDETDYSITRTHGKVPIPHTDGAGMVLPNAFGKEQKNMMIRAIWIKGLLGVFDFRKFIEVNNCSSLIKDIYGKEHDVIAEDIQVILTKSQFKLYKYYDSFDEYKENYKKFHCQTGIAKIEEERIKDATINYQMLQTLTEITDEEIQRIVKRTNNNISSICDSVENIKKTFGIDAYNTDKTGFQKAVELYPSLLNDEFVKIKLREIKDSMVKRSKAGHLQLDCKYTFVLPDFYAACEYWFKRIQEPCGLLDNGEVFCSLYRNNHKLDCLRSPHLDMAHCVRNNVACFDEYKDRTKKIEEWFTTDGVYTSTHDLISKSLQLDVDGDILLLVANKSVINVAERTIKKFDIVPLYYNMRKADAIEINPSTIYDSLNAAFVGGNIGMYSNDISKVWNSGVFEGDDEEKKKQALKCINALVCQNNFVIDYAKTLYKPEFPDFLKEEIQEYTKRKLPHYFIYAKDKTLEQVEDRNDSLVNKLESLIINPRISMKKLKLNEIDYQILMDNPDIEFEYAFYSNGKINEEFTHPVIVEFMKLNNEYRYKLNFGDEEKLKRLRADLIRKSLIKQKFLYSAVISQTRNHMNNLGYDTKTIVDILVKYMYYIKPNKYKTLLWLCYGDDIYQNMLKYLRPNIKSIKCEDCGCWFNVLSKNNRTHKCPDCTKKYNNEYMKDFMRKKRGSKMDKYYSVNLSKRL